MITLYDDHVIKLDSGPRSIYTIQYSYKKEREITVTFLSEIKDGIEAHGYS